VKALAILILASLPVPQVRVPQSPLLNREPHLAGQTVTSPRKSGKWYFARTGHAVYCYGPVMTVSNGKGGMEKVATFCRGDRMLVPLKD